MQLLKVTYDVSPHVRREMTFHQLLSLPPVLVVDVTVPGSAHLLVFLSMPVLASREEPTFAHARLHELTVSKRAICTNAHTGTYH